MEDSLHQKSNAHIKKSIAFIKNTLKSIIKKAVIIGIIYLIITLVRGLI